LRTPVNPLPIVAWRPEQEQAALATGRSAVLRPGCVYGGRQSLCKGWFEAAEEKKPLYLVGDGPYLQALHEAMPEAIFTGYLRGKELAAAYASADVFVFPSTTDTFGNVVIEAQASGVPVIVSDTGGPKELVEENVNGVVTKSHDVEDLARAIRDLVNDKRKRHQMSRQARQAVIDRSWPGAFRKFWGATEI